VARQNERDGCKVATRDAWAGVTAHVSGREPLALGDGSVRAGGSCPLVVTHTPHKSRRCRPARARPAVWQSRHFSWTRVESNRSPGRMPEPH
jgi:hypothetical protein